MGTGRRSTRVLGIDVGSELLEKWRGWYAPERQPFPVDGLSKSDLAVLPEHEERPSDEVRDTFFLYHGHRRWLLEDEFRALDTGLRRRLRALRRRSMLPKPVPRWPSELAAVGDGPLIHWVEAACRPSRHLEVAEATWHRCSQQLPRARDLAGTFSAQGSGANCFGTVLAAAGDRTAEERWVQVDEFMTWLRSETEPVRGNDHDDEPGTVLVWRENGEVAHAAVTIGDGWALVKPSQSWSSPRLLIPARQAVLGWRYPGTRLARHRLTG
jgi:hypothetical protein